MRSTFIAAALAVGISSTASAAIVTSTYEGTVLAADNTGGYFGGGDLAGLSYAAVFTFDSQVNRGTDATSDFVFSSPTETPLISAVLTVGGVDFAFNPNRFVALTFPGLSFLITDTCACGVPPGASETFFTFDADFASPASLDTGFDAAPGGASYGFFAINAHPGGDSLLSLDMTVSRVRSVVETNAVPEPATWALMILGFGGAGAALRRSRRAVAAAG